MLQDKEGNWIGDQNLLEAMVTEYFKNLFSDDGIREPTCILGAFPKLSDDDKRMLDRPVTRSEIFNAINHMGAFKAVGSDGFQAAFFSKSVVYCGGHYL